MLQRVYGVTTATVRVGYEYRDCGNSFDGLVWHIETTRMSGHDLGIISHKMSLITIFGHKHFRQKFDIFHGKFSTASDFGSYLVSNFINEG